jgi:hypothetical protein
MTWQEATAGWALTLAAVALILTASILLFTNVPALTSGAAQNVGLGVVVTAVAWLVQRQYVRSKDIVGRTRFIAFVGREAALERVTLVYPAFEMDPSILKLLQESMHPEYRFVKRRPVYGVRRADIRVLAAENDMRAVVAVANLLGERGRGTVTVRMDGDFVADGARGSFVSFGLSSNECTHHYLAGCSMVHEQPLFSIEEEDGAEHLRLFDGTRISIETERHAHFHPGLLVKYTPETDHPDRSWLFVLGLGAPSTPGIAYWLRENWEVLGRLAMATGTKEFVAVFKTEASAESNTRLIRFVPLGPAEKSLVRSIAAHRSRRIMAKYISSSP